MSVALLALTLLDASAASAQVVRPFSSRFQANEAGDVRLIGNTVVSCNTALNASCAAARDLGATTDVNNNDYFMVYVDTDGDAATFNSSSATATLPPGATILWAGLYWGGETGGFGLDGLFAPDLNAINRVKLRVPGAAAYAPITATACDRTDIGSEYGEYYQCFADISALVSGTGSGAYVVADLQTSQGFNSHGGWGVVFVYRDPAEPTRNLVVYDGFAAVTTATAASSQLNISLSGFVTPFTGTVSTRLGVLAYEGDADLGNARVSLNNTFLSNLVNPANNTFNSTISQLGQHLTNKSPNFKNQLGFDADLLDAAGVLGNNVTSATIRLETAGDFYYPGVVTFATEVYAPDFSTFDKDAVDINGGDLEPGDVIEYTFTLENTGGDPADNVVLRDTLPAQVTLVPGSIRVDNAPRTEAADGDAVTYTGATRELRVNVGAGATSMAGGAVANGARVVVRLQATLNSGVAAAAPISNQGTLSYRGRTLNRAFQVFSDDPRAAGREGATVLIVDSRPPAVDIASPAPGSTTGDDTPTITGTAEPGATLTLRINSGAPISVTVSAAGEWSYTPTVGLPDGVATITATAVDRAGNSASDNTTVNIDLTAPALSLTAPANGALTSDDRPPVTGTADPGAQVQVFIDGQPVATVTANGQGRWSYNIPQPLADGMHVVRAETADQVGNRADAQSTFTIDTTAPTIDITAPVGNNPTNDPSPVITGMAEPGAAISVEVNGQPVGMTTADANGAWTFALPQPLPDGQQTIRATARDAAGNQGSDTTSVRVDTTPPLVTITEPGDGAMIANQQPTLRGAAEPGATVEVSIDGQVVGTTVADGQGRWALPAPMMLVPGLHSVAATSTDAAGNSAQATSSFTVESPVVDMVAITEPAEGATVADPQPFIRGTAQPGAVVSVSIDGGEPIMVTADQSGMWSYRPASALADGAHTVRATAGQAADTAAFTVAAPAPTLVITSPTPGAAIPISQPTVSGTADPNATITVIVDGQPAGTVMADAQGDWSFTPAAPLADGQHSVIVTAQGPNGATVMDSVMFTIDAVPDLEPDMGGSGADMGGADMGGDADDSDYIVTGTGCATAPGAPGSSGAPLALLVAALGAAWMRRRRA